MCILYTVYPPLVLDTDGGHPPPPLPCSTADVRPIFKAVSGVLSSYFNTKVSCFIFGEPHSGSNINVFIIVWRDDPLIMFDREVCFVGNFFRFFFFNWVIRHIYYTKPFMLQQEHLLLRTKDRHWLSDCRSRWVNATIAHIGSIVGHTQIIHQHRPMATHHKTSTIQ